MTRAIPTPRISTLASLTLALTLFAAGCSTGPHRVETSETTRYETSDARILPVTLHEFPDILAQDLAQVLPELRANMNIPGRVTIAFGDIQNNTGNVSSQEFDLVRQRMRTTLTQSRLVTSQVRFVESRARMNALIRTETGHMDQEVDKIDLDNAWVLNMNIYRVPRARMNEYAMFAQLVDFRTGEIVFSRDYDSKQVRARQ